MNRQKANIDLLFRNGLKDYEVLPPKESWAFIRPHIRKPRPMIILLRVAATVAVLLSVSILAYRYGRQISTQIENNLLAVDEQVYAPVIAAASPEVVGNFERPLASAFIADASDQVPAARNNNVTNDSITAIGNILYTALPDLNANERNLRLHDNTPAMNEPDISSFDLLGNAELAVSEDPLIRTTPRWTIAALASPAYYSRIISGNADIASSMTSGQQPAFSYTGGLAVSYKVNKRLSVQSGLYYSAVGQELTGISTFGGFREYDYSKGGRNFAVRTANGTIHTNNPDVFLRDNAMGNRVITMYTNDVFDPSKANLKYLNNILHQNLGYLEFPIILRYKVIDKGIDFNIIGGVSSNVLVNNSVYTSIDGQKYEIGKTDGVNMISFSSSVGMGMEYNFSGNFSFNIEPTLRYYINPFSPVAGVKIHPYSFGLFSGLIYKF
ncbi:MAG TPA: outer membrane beta-barrel protein [Bacteroidales bacterium]|jgi:hypothetical protein|nr:outer membrane beta-barrel protein [Bacteroidales bacterium]